MTDMFHELLNAEKFVDVTLACEHNSLKAHKVVLSACSSFFQKLLLENPCKHPTIILPSDICFSDLQFIIEFVYRGEIDVSEAELESLIRTAEQLKIKGLCEINDHTGAESDPEIIYPPHKKSRASKRFENNNNLANANKNLPTPVTPLNTSSSSTSSAGNKYSKSSVSVLDKNGSPIALSEYKHSKHTKSPSKESRHSNSNSDSTSNKNNKKMASLEMGMTMNGSVVMGVPMTYLDFAPEPPAPTATPVVTSDLNCTPSNDTKDLSKDSNSTNGVDAPRIIKFETLRSLDPSETIDFDSHVSQHSIQRLDHHTSNNNGNNNINNNHSHHHNHSPVSSNSPILHHPHHQQQLTPPQIITTCSSPMDNGSMILKTTITTTAPNIIHHDHNEQQQQQQFIDQQRLRLQQTNNMEVDANTNNSDSNNVHGIVVTPEIVTMMTPTQMDMYNSDTSEDAKMMSDSNGQVQYITLGNANDPKTPTSGPKTWTPNDMESALEALRTHNMSLTKASATYGIPSTTLWQRAHRLGIDTPKKEGPTKTWNEDSLNNALDALRTGTISANKASKAFGIPSSTLYKIARREGIRLAAPFNAAPTTWSAEDLEKALEAIRAGAASVQKASTEFGIPTGTLYGRCKREGIELSRSNPTPWSEDAMMEALEAVRVGQMSINQAAIHFNLPYSSLYGRFKRGKYDNTNGNGNGEVQHNTEHSPENSISNHGHVLLPENNFSVSNLQENIIYQQHYSPSSQIHQQQQQHHHQQPPPLPQQYQTLHHHQQIIYQHHPPPSAQILQLHQIKKETS
ncbi:unnamed protein product [Diamesa hyperborea]